MAKKPLVTDKPDREVAATLINLKEESILKKKLHTLDLECEFSRKLLDVNRRVVKISCKRLKEQGEKIKTRLTPEVLCELRKKDIMGKLGAEYSQSPKPNNAIKIAAAAKRLKLRPQRAKSAKIRSQEPTISTSTLHQSSSLAEVSRSLADLSFSQTPKESTISLQKTEGRLSPMLISRRPSIMARPHTAAVVPKTSAPTSSDTRPRTAGYSLSARDSGQRRRDKSLLDGFDRVQVNSHHISARSRIGHDDIDDNLCFEPSSKRQQIVAAQLKEEEKATAIVQQKKERFFKRLEVSASTEQDAVTVLESKKTLNFAQYILRRMRENGISDSSTSLRGTRSRKLTGKDIWKGINKIRYLRVPDDKLDLSGINTLASEQLRMMSLVRTQTHRRENPFGTKVNDDVE